MNVNRPARTFMVLPGKKPAYPEDPNCPGERRLPEFRWLPNRARRLLISTLGEFVGTALFLTFAFAATQVANTFRNETLDSAANIASLLYVSLAFGFSLLVNIWIFSRIGGGLFNPAVSLALALVGAIGWIEAFIFIHAQIMGAITAAAIVSGLFPGPLAVRTTLNDGVSITRGLFIEAICTAELILAVLMLAAEKHQATFLAPIGIGLALFVGELVAVFFTGGSLNPARSIGPDIVLGEFDGYHWIYWVGPLLGAVFAVLFYRFIKFLEYETANPDADSGGRDNRDDDLHAKEDAGEPRRGRRVNTDGTAESDFFPSIHPLTTPLSEPDGASLPRHHDNRDRYIKTRAIPLSSLPNMPPATFHGYDGHHSIDHPNERPRAQHRPSSFSARSRSRTRPESRYDHPNERPRAQHRPSSFPARSRSRRRPESRYEEDSETSYRSGPSTESGRSDYSSSSSS